LFNDEIQASHNNYSGNSDNLQQRNQRKREEGGTKKNRNRIANDKKMAAMNVKTLGHNTNFKRSIEIRNGIAIRSTNNVHRMTNAITLHCYIVSLKLLCPLK